MKFVLLNSDQQNFEVPSAPSSLGWLYTSLPVRHRDVIRLLERRIL
jgi:hypothetical protein